MTMREGFNGGVNTGGGLTMNQLGKFMYFMYHKTDAEIPPGFIVLDEKNKSLNNDTFAVFYNPENVHLIAVHRGTNLKSISDIGNNIRNFFFTETDALITKRNRLAKEGHIELKKRLIHMYKQKAKTEPIFSGIIQFIENTLYSSRLKSLPLEGKTLEKSLGSQNDHELFEDVNILEYAVTHFLRNKLTTIGHSQGAVYAYLYGDQGFETIVFNPAPYKGCKPVNTYLIRNKGDIVSYFTKLKSKDKHIKNSKIFHNYVNDEKVSKHSTNTLFQDFRFVGNPLLMNTDLDKPIRDKPIRNKTQKKSKKSIQKKSISKKTRS